MQYSGEYIGVIVGNTWMLQREAAVPRELGIVPYGLDWLVTEGKNGCKHGTKTV